jgi:pyruvate/2-oxoglutarate/acetoin dehydrogenase E1 component/TPP-dependent pyruvate/acetoin dehydrogenase alpha subunit
MPTKHESQGNIDFDTFRLEILADYRLACESREASLLGRKEVLTGKAKFGIFGDGKEIAQIALAKQFKNGDFRSGYYRDQTLMMAIGQLTLIEYFAGLYGETQLDLEPQSAGRQMGGHYATRSLDSEGNWLDLMAQKNSSADISPTGGQMPRLLGLALASKIYRNNKTLSEDKAFSIFTDNGNEVAFGTIGDASTSEGPFWETINAAGVLQVPMVMSVWDDGFGISVPREFQTSTGSISQALAGMQRTEHYNGLEIFECKGWDYPNLCATYEKAVNLSRSQHIPTFVHVKEVNQPQGHSTSGSHERYKSAERLKWETEFDCIAKFKEWILNFKAGDLTLADETILSEIQVEAKNKVREAKNKAWANYTQSIQTDLKACLTLLENVLAETSQKESVLNELTLLKKSYEPVRKDILTSARNVLRIIRHDKNTAREALSNWVKASIVENDERYSSFLHSQSDLAATKISAVPPLFSEENIMEDGRIILRENYNKLLQHYPALVVFGEDAGKIGGVNQTLEGLQDKFGDLRVFDTGIRECTIIGQGIGMAMRGLRPIAEIQYLDYLLYAIQIMSDDLATLQYRTKGGQKAPLIISTRGHRLEGIWHSGSPMGMIINSLRGIHVCVPRNMTKAAGFYNTLMAADEPALVIEPLNGYRSKERMPNNLGLFREPLGIPEIVRQGKDLTVVSYGSTFNLCEIAAVNLAQMGIEITLIDVQTLLPFDVNHLIVNSLKETNSLLIVDEDVSSGATGFMLNKILVEQNGYYHLDEEPATLSAKDHRPAYGTDGDYFSKPSIDDIVEKIYGMMQKTNPSAFPPIY